MLILFSAIAIAIFLSLVHPLALHGRVLTWWAERRPAIVAYLRSAPATVAYGIILLTTTAVYFLSDPSVRTAILREKSTNLHNLVRAPEYVLYQSAFWTGSLSSILFDMVVFVLVLAAMERWLGTLRLIVVFWTGHILATLITAYALEWAIQTHVAGSRVRWAIDVGTSYGVYCCCALFTYRLPRKWRPFWAAGWVVYGIVSVLIAQDFTAFGHLTTILIGLAMYPITLNADARARLATPIWHVPAALQPVRAVVAEPVALPPPAPAPARTELERLPQAGGR